MKKKLLAAMVIPGLSVLTIVSGCTMNRIDLVDRGVLSLEQHNTGKVYIAWSGAYGQDDSFVVTGVLRRRDSVGTAIRAHVDVTILSPDGTILDEARSGDVYVSRRIAGRSYLSFERFKLRFSDIPAKGSLVHLVSHSGRHDDTSNIN